MVHQHLRPKDCKDLDFHHMIDFCVVKVFVALLETKEKFLKLMKGPWVRNKYILNKQCSLLFLETNNVFLESLLKQISILTIQSISV